MIHEQNEKNVLAVAIDRSSNAAMIADRGGDAVIGEPFSEIFHRRLCSDCAAHEEHHRYQFHGAEHLGSSSIVRQRALAVSTIAQYKSRSVSQTLHSLALTPLHSAEYAEFAESHVHEYARQHVNAAEWEADGAIDHARSELKELLNDSLRAVGHLFFKAVDQNAKRVGWIWIAPAPEFLGPGHERTRWLSQITV